MTVLATCAESSLHLFALCPFALGLGRLVLDKLHIAQDKLPTSSDRSQVAWWERSSAPLSKDDAKTWRSVIAIVWCSSWKERNERVFRQHSCSVTIVFHQLQMEARSWSDAGRRRVQALVERPLEPD